LNNSRIFFISIKKWCDLPRSMWCSGSLRSATQLPEQLPYPPAIQQVGRNRGFSLERR